MDEKYNLTKVSSVNYIECECGFKGLITDGKCKCGASVSDFRKTQQTKKTDTTQTPVNA